MTTYLNKEAVLKAAKDAMTWPEHAAGLVMRIERGEFDAHMGAVCSKCNIRLAHIDLKDKTQGKDAEIARLKEKCDAAIFAPHRLGGPWDQLHKAVAENQTLRDRISELEKLTELQKETIDAQGKALQEARPPKCIVPCPYPEEGCPWYAVYEDERGTRHCCMKWRDENDGKGIIHACEEPAQKEPELVICEGALDMQPIRSSLCDPCRHGRPHKKDEDCYSLGCRINSKKVKCVPVKSPVPTSGTGTAPEGATVEQKHDDFIDAIQYVWVKHPLGKDDLDYLKMAKDIGDLTLRTDNLESETRHLNARLHEIEQRQGRDRAEEGP